MKIYSAARDKDAKSGGHNETRDQRPPTGESPELGASPRIFWRAGAAGCDSLGGVSKTLRAWDVDQAWLLPPSVHEFVPAGRLAYFVRDTVREGLDLSAIRCEYKAEQGQPPHHPGMLEALSALFVQVLHPGQAGGIGQPRPCRDGRNQAQG